MGRFHADDDFGQLVRLEQILNPTTEQLKALVMVAELQRRSQCNSPIADRTSNVSLLGNIYTDNQMQRASVFNELILLVLGLSVVLKKR